MTRLKVVHFTSAHWAFDTRIFYKECVSLAGAGYDVVLVVPHTRDEVRNDVRIRAVPIPNSREQRVKRTIRQVYRAAVEEDGDVYHFHDPELFLSGLWLKLRGKRVIYDIHENIPAQILGKDYIKPDWMRKSVANLARVSEKVALAAFDGLVIANPVVAQRFESDKAITVANYPILGLVDDISPANMPVSGRPVLIYVGGLTPIRGIYELIQAVEILPVDVELWLAGAWSSDAFRHRCESLSGWNRVRYLGQLTPVEVYAYLKRADIGLATLHPQENYLTNLPVKGFEYMACSLPMVMSDFPYWREIFSGAAMFVDPTSPQAIASAIQFLLQHPEEASQLGATGRRMVEERFSWEAESKKLLALYERILDSQTRGS